MGEYKKRDRTDQNRKTKKKGGILSAIILIVAVVVFCFSGLQLFRIFYGYHKGEQEYKKLKDIGLSTEDDSADGGGRYLVDFEELWKVNPDIVAWIRFDGKTIRNIWIRRFRDIRIHTGRFF